MKHLSLLLKPASGNCNLRCKYCFYHDVANNRLKGNYGMMSDSLLETIVQKAFEEAEVSCTFAFQGGEPTLAGLDFYKNLIELQKKYNTREIAVQNAIQTNGMLIDKNWASFFAENNFLVGLSMDGDQNAHDMHRKDGNGAGSFHQVMKTSRLFDQSKVDYNVLCVVTNHVAKHIDKIYRFFKKNNFRYLQFIPCLDPLGKERGGNAYSLTKEKYYYFLKTLFDRWYEDFKKGDYYSIRQFDEYIHMLAGRMPQSCGMLGVCACYFVIEADGSVYPCDFYVLDQWKIGNIQEDSFYAMQNSETAKRFTKMSQHVDEKCKTCQVWAICRGGCRRDREPITDEKPGLNYFCDAYSAFFHDAGGRMLELSNMLRQ